MSTPPLPIVCKPLFKPKPWGGRRLATLFGKPLPPDTPIGESWELVNLPDNESLVRGGSLAGKSLGELLQTWGADLLGKARPVDDRFPLLIKFLDAREHLSVQVHPKPDPHATDFQPGIKHEAWYVLHAEPDAKLFIGLKPGVTPEDVKRVANTPDMVGVLREWPGRTGQCYYLPSGTLHALGAGLVVAEVQTPSDVTYRAYDWNRVGLDGQPRELHIEQSLANIRYDVTDDMILQPTISVDTEFGTATRVTACERFAMDIVERPAGFKHALRSGQMSIWMLLTGSARLITGGYKCPLTAGDTALLPAAGPETHLELETAAKWIRVTIPQ